MNNQDASQAAPAGVTAVDQVDREAPLTLKAAAGRAFPDGTMTVRTLRAERDRGRLETWIIGKREYTSLAAIAKMIELCRTAPRAASASREKAASPSTSFDITKTRPGPDSALRSLERLKERLERDRPKGKRRRAV
ncbi:hypothetical protein [Bosea sp. TAF32]|uniref:hypothetical protein n=1 Tax=Bosea sp. TAF32 TaxID=3237482 RepID=UPI003F8FEED1